MRRGILSLLAIVLSIPVLYSTITGRQSLETAAVRIMVLAVAVTVIDHYIAPWSAALFRSLAGTERDASPSAR